MVFVSKSHLPSLTLLLGTGIIVTYWKALDKGRFLVTGDKQFWMEAWPGVPLKAPAVKLYAVSAVRGEYFLRGEQLGTGVPPAELHLRSLFDLHLDRPDDVARFLTTYGWIREAGPLDFAVRTYGERRLRVMDELWTDDNPRPDWAHMSFEEMQATRVDLPEYVLAEEVAGRVTKLRNAVRAWDCLSGSSDWASLGREWEGAYMVDREALSFVVAPGDTEMAAAFIDVAINRGLEVFHPRVFPSTLEGPHLPLSTSEPDLHEALCLMIYNDVAEGAPYRRCQNDNCGSRFKRKEGGSPMGQPRTIGTLWYCSVSCQEAQKAREYRRRQRQKGAKP